MILADASAEALFLCCSVQAAFVSTGDNGAENLLQEMQKSSVLVRQHDKQSCLPVKPRKGTLRRNTKQL